MADSEAPLAKKFCTVNGRRLAYAEEGVGCPIVLIHGNPTSSYLWRNLGFARLGECDRVSLGHTPLKTGSRPGLDGGPRDALPVVEQLA
jgi:haloalkane dehalogenase